ncbi:hypothetical protein BGX24_008852 [Mortierella sp. AD032]|nr:hypothetical protein BGX24_008852 [Mortierella sp. AD032]
MTPSLILQAVDDKINYLDNLWRSGSDKLSQTAKVTEQGVLTCVLHQVLEDFRIYADLREMLQNQDLNGQMGAIETLHETMRQLETSSTVQESGSVTSKSITNAKAKATADNLTTTPPPPSSSKPAVTAVVNNSAYVLVKTTNWDKKNTDTATDQSTFPNAQLDHTSSTATPTTTKVKTPLDANAGLLPAPGPGAPTTTTTTTTAPMTSGALGNRHTMMDIEQELRRIRQEGQEQRLRTDQLLAQLESEARLRREADSRVAQLSRDLQNERLLTLEKDLESKRSEALLMMAKAREEIQHGKILIAQAKEELAVERAAKAEAMVETARIQVERNRLLEVIQSLGGSLPESGNVGAQHRQE